MDIVDIVTSMDCPHGQTVYREYADGSRYDTRAEGCQECVADYQRSCGIR